MDDHDTQLLAQHPLWQRVLSIYLAESQIKVEKTDEEDSGPRWAQRVSQLDELDPEDLIGIHGQLIAMGWLKFQIEDRTCGMTYRISTSGKNTLKRATKLTKKLEAERAAENTEATEVETPSEESVSQAA